MRSIIALVAALLLTAPAISGTAAQDAATLSVAQDPKLGAFLTDATGKTLYLFTKDTEPGTSACTDQCATNWPPLTASDGMSLPTGVPGTLGTLDRADGTTQVTYNDIPLYSYAKDDEAGDSYGEGVGGVWFVVPPGAELGPYAAAPGEGTPTPASTLHVGFKEELGPYLTDSEGKTVYLFLKDVTPAQSTCEGDCAKTWPPVPATEAMRLPAGIQGTLSAIDRADGSTQLAYNDIPLYSYAEDDEAGDTYGQEVGDVWYVVTPGMHFGEEPHEGDAAHKDEPATGSGTPEAAAGAQTVQVSLGDMTITPSLTTYAVGVPYTFVVTNQDTTEHELVIEHRGDVDQPMEASGHESEADDIEPGEAKTVTWTFTEAGDYQLACHVPGHYEAGMVAPITVTP